MLAIILLTQEVFLTLVFGGSLVSLFALCSMVKKHGLFRVLFYPFRAIKERVCAYRFLYDAPRIIQEGYDKAGGGHFSVNGVDVNYHFVSDNKLIKEIDHAPRDVLSLQAAAKTLLQPEYSMHRFNWAEERGFDGTPLVRTLRSLLRNDLPYILPKIREINSGIIDDMMSKPGKQPTIYAITRACVSRSNALAFFGEEVASNKEFMDAAVRFVDEAIVIAESVRLLGGVFGRLFARFLETQLTAQHTIFNTLVPIAQKRIDEQELARSGHPVPQHKDCIQWVMEQSSRLRPWSATVTAPWKAERIVHELMALWFGSVHAMGMAITFAIRDIATHPEYLEPLRREIEGPAYKAWETTGNGLPLLDSFLKESARMNPLDNVGTRRMVLKPFELSNGVRVERGDWLTTPLAPMLRDPKRWIDPHEFNGFRHVDEATLASLEHPEHFDAPELDKAAPLTDTRGWQTWGTGRMACPGRFYASAGIKQIFSLIIEKYNVELTDRDSPVKFSWRTCNAPRPNQPIRLRPRALAG